MRTVLFWMHLTAGVLASGFILFFSITGALLAFERPILRFADERSYQQTAPKPGTDRLPLEQLLAITEAIGAGSVDTVTIYRDLQSPVEVQLSNRTLYQVDPYAGTIHGPVSPRLRAFMFEATALHRWFGLSEAHHRAAIAVKGVVVLLFLFLLASGAFLWVPRRLNLATVRAGTLPRFDASGRARNYNWHRVAGFWLGIPLAIVAATGAVMAYPWANALLFRLAGSPLPTAAATRQGARDGSPRHRPVAFTNLTDSFTAATSATSDWRSASVRIAGSSPALTIMVDSGDGGEPQKRVQVSIDATTHLVLRREPFAALSRGQRWRRWVRFIHTGEAGGIMGETVALITTLGAIVLSCTGILLSSERAIRWARRR